MPLLFFDSALAALSVRLLFVVAYELGGVGSGVLSCGARSCLSFDPFFVATGTFVDLLGFNDSSSVKISSWSLSSSSDEITTTRLPARGWPIVCQIQLQTFRDAT